MAAIAGSLNLPLAPSNLPLLRIKQKNCKFSLHIKSNERNCFPNLRPTINQNQNQTHTNRPTSLNATLRRPKGFGPASRKKKTKKTRREGSEDDDNEEEEEEDEEEEEEGGVIPEVVTNRMMSRMGFTVGIPLFIGLLFFPFFYYLKVGLKIDVPSWVPVIVSFFFFGSALLGVSYGIVSSSWDPLREGSLLGWNEAQKNWPVFWKSIWGGSNKK
ncbi:protein PAM68, chloroplastic isoform X1 [Cucumis sativus]|uniref:protein PAM68, chloroplastic isoform X1 n=1 Tax=Cucumis sativus TaxID=3659 RepID=UPI0005ECDD2C|nr:protein PAM68, chloroplastic isoform X1 [Cucumis sativus]